MIAELRYRY